MTDHDPYSDSVGVDANDQTYSKGATFIMMRPLSGDGNDKGCQLP